MSAVSLAALAVGAPLLGYHITAASLFANGFGWTKLAFLVGLSCSLVGLVLRRKQFMSRRAEAASLVFHLLGIAYALTASVMAVVQAPQVLDDARIGFTANWLSSLGYLCLGLLIWAFAGLLARR